MKRKSMQMANTNNIMNHLGTSNLEPNLYLKKTCQWIYPLVLVTILLSIIMLIEYKYPYFFLQDDNRDFFLPYFVHNYESLLIGEIPLYNFHQFLGTPSLAVGQSAALYPITYLSVFLSDLFFEHYFAAIDIQVILHLLIGAVGFYKFIRFFDVERKVALFAGLTWPLSSFIIYVSNSWVVVSGVAAYFPWMLLFSFQIYKTVTHKATIYAVIVRLLLFYAGHIQYFIYSVIFEFITVILFVMSDSKPGEKKLATFRFLKKYIVGYIYVFVFSLPLLLPMWHQTTISAARSCRLPFGAFASQYFPICRLFIGMFCPFLHVSGYAYTSFTGNGNLSHIGYLTVIILLIGIIIKFAKKYKNMKVNSVRLSVFIKLALLALLWTTNRVFNLLIYLIPILNRFRWPFKVAIYFDFYIIIISSLILAHISTLVPWKKTSKNLLFCLLLGIQLMNFVFIYAISPYQTFRYHGDSVPLKESLQDKLSEGRIISIGFDKSQNNRTAPSLGFNYATLLGLYYFAGYEPLISTENSEACLGLNYIATIESDELIPVDYLRKAAVSWYIIPKNKVEEYTKKLSSYGIIKKYSDENRAVFFDAKASSMIYNSNGEKIDGQDYRITTNNIELSIDNEKANRIIFNNLYNPFFKGYIDGKMTTITPIDNIHFSISVPKGKHNIIIKYRDPYLMVGTYIATLFFIICIIRYIFNRNKIIEIKR